MYKWNIFDITKPIYILFSQEHTLNKSLQDVVTERKKSPPESPKQEYLFLKRHMPIQIIIPSLHSRCQKVKLSDLHLPLTPSSCTPNREIQTGRSSRPADAHEMETHEEEEKVNRYSSKETGTKDREETLSSIQETFHRFE